MPEIMPSQRDVVSTILSAPGWRVAEKSRFCAMDACALKYQRWYDDLMNRARLREIPACYTEQHHIVVGQTANREFVGPHNSG